MSSESVYLSWETLVNTSLEYMNISVKFNISVGLNILKKSPEKILMELI